jgi:hypothetical protein
MKQLQVRCYGPEYQLVISWLSSYVVMLLQLSLYLTLVDHVPAFPL